MPCKYDYSVTLNREYGHWAKYYETQFIALKDSGLRRGMTKIKFENETLTILI